MRGHNHLSSPGMTNKTQDVPKKRRSPVLQETEVPGDLKATLALAEESARIDRKRMSEYEQVLALLRMFSPNDVGQFLNAFSIDGIVNFLRQIPQFSVSLAQCIAHYFKSLYRS